MSPFLPREQVLALIHEHAPPHLWQVLEENLAPAIGIIAREADDASLAIGASKIAGAPDVPRGFEWPAWKGQPLGFIAQFNLQEVTPFDLESALPSRGTLSFFYTPDDRLWGARTSDFWRVFWWPCEEPLRRVELPLQTSKRGLLPACALAFATEWTLPESYTAQWVGDTLSDQEHEEANEVRAVLEEARASLPAHRLLGFADPVQDDVLLCACLQARAKNAPRRNRHESFEAVHREAADWRLLFQLDSQHDPPTRKSLWMWGDEGKIYFCIRHDDLKARRFDRAWLQLQCH